MAENMEAGDHPLADPSHKVAQSKIPGIGHALLFMLIFSNVAGIISLIMIGAIILIQILISTSGGLENIAIGELPINWLTGISNIAAAAVVLKIGAVWSGRPRFEILPFRRFKPSLTVAIVLMGIGFSITLSEADNLLQYVMPMPDWLMTIMLEMTSGGVGGIILLVVIAPFTEEMLFRGLFLNGFLSRYSPRKSIIISALMFSVIHLNPYQMIGAFVLGLVLGWLRERTGSLWPCIILHAASNAMVVMGTSLPVEIPGYNMIDNIHRFQPLWFDALGLVVAVSGAVLAAHLMKVRPISDRTVTD